MNRYAVVELTEGFIVKRPNTNEPEFHRSFRKAQKICDLMNASWNTTRLGGYGPYFYKVVKVL